MRGFFGIGHYQPNSDTNSGTTFRTAYSFGASFIYTIGRKYKKQSSDTCGTTNHIPYLFYQSFEDFELGRPRGSSIVAVELSPNARSLNNFIHPEKAIYLLGNEGYGIPECILKKCNLVVQIPVHRQLCLNVATAASIIMYDRYQKTLNK